MLIYSHLRRHKPFINARQNYERTLNMYMTSIVINQQEFA